MSFWFPMSAAGSRDAVASLLVCALVSFCVSSPPTFVTGPATQSRRSMGNRLPSSPSAAPLAPVQASSPLTSVRSGLAVVGLGLLLGTCATRSRTNSRSSAKVKARAVVSLDKDYNAVVPTNRVEKGQSATPQQIPVVDLDGNKVGEETLHFYTWGKDNANYIVAQAWRIWTYQQKTFTRYIRRRGDYKTGSKPWKQKGGGRARAGSKFNPIWGTTGSNMTPYGLDNKRELTFPRVQGLKSISTVLQSKWRGMTIVEGLEDWPEARQGELEKVIENASGVKPGLCNILMITRNGYGELCRWNLVPLPQYRDNKLYMSGRLIKKFEMRRPRDIDEVADGLFQCLKARRVIISREAFFDLKAKFDAKTGWAPMRRRRIQMKMMQALAKEFPYDRQAEIEAARALPREAERRMEWAAEQRKIKELEAGF